MSPKDELLDALDRAYRQEAAEREARNNPAQEEEKSNDPIWQASKEYRKKRKGLIARILNDMKNSQGEG